MTSLQRNISGARYRLAIALILTLAFPFHYVRAPLLVSEPISTQQVVLYTNIWGGGSDYGQGVAQDSLGNAYVTGWTNIFRTYPCCVALVLLKYNSTGGLVWQRVFGGGTSKDGRGVAVDHVGDIYVTGKESNSSGDVLLLKFSPSGNLLWQRTWGGSGQDFGLDVVADSSANVYVAGQTSSFGAGSADLLLLKFDSTGNLLWQETWGGSNFDSADGLVLDSSENIYVTGQTCSSTVICSALLLKLDSSGKLLFQESFGSGKNDAGLSVAADSKGNIYLAGATLGFGAGAGDILILKLNSTGSLVWQRTWGGSCSEQGNHVALDSHENIYIAGSSCSFGATYGNAVLLRLDPSGNLLSSLLYGDNNGSIGVGLSVDAGGDAVVSGFTSGASFTTRTGNATLGTPTLTPSVLTYSLGHPAFLPSLSNGVVSTPAGSEIYAGGTDFFLFKYGFIPTLMFETNPPFGSITFNRTNYMNGQKGIYTYGTVNASANSPIGFAFASWGSAGGVIIANSTINPTRVTIAGPGTLTANFSPTESTTLAAGSIVLAILFSYFVLLRRRRKKQPSSPSTTTEIQQTSRSNQTH